MSKLAPYTFEDAFRYLWKDKWLVLATAAGPVAADNFSKLAGWIVLIGGVIWLNVRFHAWNCRVKKDKP